MFHTKTFSSCSFMLWQQKLSIGGTEAVQLLPSQSSLALSAAAAGLLLLALLGLVTQAAFTTTPLDMHFLTPREPFPEIQDTSNWPRIGGTPTNQGSRRLPRSPFLRIIWWEYLYNNNDCKIKNNNNTNSNNNNNYHHHHHQHHHHHHHHHRHNYISTSKF